MMHRLDLTDNERAVLITALRRLVDFDRQPLSPQIQALKAILERLEPQKPQTHTRYCEHRVSAQSSGEGDVLVQEGYSDQSLGPCVDVLAVDFEVLVRRLTRVTR